RVGQLTAIEIRLLHEAVESAVGAQERDPEAPRLVHRLHQKAGRAAGQRRQIARSIQIIAIEHQKTVRTELSPAGAESVPGPTRLLLVDGLPLSEVALAAQIRLDLIRQV